MSQFASGVASAVNHLRATTNQWHHPYISRGEGVQLLEGCEAGSFILRESSKGGSYALSVVLPNGGQLGHYLVEKRGPERFCLQGSENSFCAIEELLAHYHHHDSIGLPCRLRLPQRHSASMSLASRPALPPRNPSPRANSVSRPHTSRAHTKLSPTPSNASTSPSLGSSVSPPIPKVPIKPHLDVGSGRQFGGAYSPEMDVPQLSHFHGPTPRSPILPQSPRPITTSAMSSAMSHLPPGNTIGNVDDEGGETYEDMASGAMHAVTARPTPPAALSHISASAMQMDDEGGETYEDMASGTIQAAVSARRQPQPVAQPPPAEDEFGETYEDMSVNSAMRQSSHGGPVPPPHSMHGGHGGHGGHPTPGHALGAGAPPAEEDGEMYEDMQSVASVSPALRR